MAAGVTLIVLGLAAGLVGGFLTQLGGTSADVAGWAVTGFGGLLATVGVIALGVLLALREHARTSR